MEPALVLGNGYLHLPLPRLGGQANKASPTVSYYFPSPPNFEVPEELLLSF